MLLMRDSNSDVYLRITEMRQLAQSFLLYIAKNSKLHYIFNFYF